MAQTFGQIVAAIHADQSAPKAFVDDSPKTYRVTLSEMKFSELVVVATSPESAIAIAQEKKADAALKFRTAREPFKVEVRGRNDEHGNPTWIEVAQPTP